VEFTNDLLDKVGVVVDAGHRVRQQRGRLRQAFVDDCGRFAAERAFPDGTMA